MAFNIESVPNQAGRPAILLREAWREGKRIRKRTVANLSKFPPHIVEGFRAVLGGAVAVRDVGDLMQVERSLPHGHVAAVLGTARDLGLERILHRIGTEAAVEACKSLATVERAFRNGRGGLRIRPVYVHSADHVRAHVFLCMLALHVEWHMRRRLAPMLSGDDGREGARARRNPPVERAGVSASAKARADTKRTVDGLPVHSLRTLLDDLSGLALNQLRLPGHGDSLLTVVTKPTPVQKRAFRLLGVKPDRNVPIRMTG